MELRIEYTEPFCDRMTFEDLERHNERVRDEVGIDCRVEDLDCPVVRSTEEEREARREGD